MAREDHLEGRDVDAEFAAIVAGWDLAPGLWTTSATTTTRRMRPPRVPRPPDPEAADDEPGAPRRRPCRAAPPPTPRPRAATDLPSMPGFPSIASAVPVPTPRRPGRARGAAPGRDRAVPRRALRPRPRRAPPQEDLHFWGIVIGLAAGPLLLLWSLLFGEAHSRWWVWIGAALTLGGFALLVLRQPKERDDDDDGARV